MVRFFAIFNLVAGGASITGLYATVFESYHGPVLLIVFGVVILVSLYVLFVPGNTIERNVRSKFERYRSPTDGALVGVQRGDFAISSQPVAIEFPVPFADVPSVEIIDNRGSSEKPPEITEITPHQVVFDYTDSWRPGTNMTFSWVARGEVLERLSGE